MKKLFKYLIPTIAMLIFASCSVTPTIDGVDISNYVYSLNDQIFYYEYSDAANERNMWFNFHLYEVRAGEEILIETPPFYGKGISSNLFTSSTNYSSRTYKRDYNFINIDKTTSFSESGYYVSMNDFLRNTTANKSYRLEVVFRAHRGSAKFPSIYWLGSVKFDIQKTPTIYRLDEIKREDAKVTTEKIPTHMLKTFTKSLIGFPKSYDGIDVKLKVRITVNGVPLGYPHISDIMESDYMFDLYKVPELGKDLLFFDLSNYLFNECDAWELEELAENVLIETCTVALNGVIISAWMPVPFTGLYYISLANTMGGIPIFTYTPYEGGNKQ